MKICPCCGSELIAEKVLANYGRYIEVDHCKNCGGIWFDKYELMILDPNEVPKFSIYKGLISSCQGPLFCPNDKNPLRVLKDLFIPKDIFIYYCENCFGMWLPFESLKKYKDYQRSKIEKKEVGKTGFPKELEEKINLLLESGEKLQEENNIDDLEVKMTQFISWVFIILRILSFFIKK